MSRRGWTQSTRPIPIILTRSRFKLSNQKAIFHTRLPLVPPAPRHQQHIIHLEYKQIRRGGAYQRDSPERRRMSPYPKCIKEWRRQHVAGIKRGFDVKEEKKGDEKGRKKKERVYIELQSFKLLPAVCDCSGKSFSSSSSVAD